METRKIEQQKKQLRLQIAKQKKEYTAEDLLLKSEEVFSVLEITGQFRDAKVILIYNSMSDEVSTHDFIKKWSDEKTFYMPVIRDDKICFCRLDQDTEFAKSKIGVDEPTSDKFLEDYKKVHLVIVPGVAFDRNCNRLGRGKGYYDCFLSKHKNIFKVGICFDFQLLDEIPSDNLDVKMDMLVSENDLIW